MDKEGLRRDKKLNIVAWYYGIVHNIVEKEFVVAEIYENEVGGLSWSEATVCDKDKKRLASLLSKLSLRIQINDIYIWDGEELKR